MKIILVAIGKRHDTGIAAAINNYTGRLQRYAKVEWHIIAPQKAAMSAHEQRALETRKVLEVLKPGDTVILLDERGQELSVPQVTAKLEDLRGNASRAVFVIGGAHGVTDELRQRAAFVWSLSRLVFPHQIVRLILTEQLYRAFTVLSGEPYHHA